MYKVTPSLLETYRKFYNEEYNGLITQEKVIEAVKGLTPWTARMELGTAFHAIIEHGAEPFYDPDSDRYIVNADGLPSPFVFQLSEIEEAIKYRNQYPDMTHEVMIENYTNVDGIDIMLRFKVDGLNGGVIHEHKTMKQFPSMDMFHRSLQWRCYLWGLNARQIQYNFFVYKDLKGKPITVSYFKHMIFTYPEIEQDLKKWIRQFLEFCDIHDILEYLIPKQKAVIEESRDIRAN